jgi:hypothetical protein
MGTGSRKENASEQKLEPGFDSIKAGIALVVRFPHLHPVAAGVLANVRVKGPLAELRCW